MDEVKLLGTWPSPLYYRVVWALKFKGIAYKFIEDLTNKSPLLLHYSPVHKKIPVLLHGGNSICESMIILEYIQQICPQNSLLPTHPYGRAVDHFWIKFTDEKAPAIWMGFRSSGEEQKKAVEDSLEMLQMIEEHAVGMKSLFGGDEIYKVDIAFGQLMWLQLIEDVTGVKLLEATNFPRLQRWFHNFKQVPVIKANLPDYQHMFGFFKRSREIPFHSHSLLCKCRNQLLKAALT
ncbi:probable glutathione S-transferase [Hibiscus syriacus]|uniref:probable glutathione S-transferase n=1 Tax=Hibiscus syriacus TaxID=106335 RepID=UPI001922A64B|nr:probable glutathione S-transferase [Hibiscus syriacus]